MDKISARHPLQSGTSCSKPTRVMSLCDKIHFSLTYYRLICAHSDAISNDLVKFSKLCAIRNLKRVAKQKINETNIYIYQTEN